MKKQLSILLSVILLLLSGCASTDSNPATNQPKDEKISYTIYYSHPTTINSEDIDSKGQSVYTFESADTKDFTLKADEPYQNANAAESKTVTIDGQSLTLSYRESFDTPLAKCKTTALQANGSYDLYRFSDDMGNDIDVHFRKNSNELIYYLNVAAYSTIGGNYTDEDATIRAANDLVTYFGMDAITYYQEKYINSSEDFITVTYIHCINDYQTTDQIVFIYNRSGQLALMNADHKGVFDAFEKQLTSENLQAAKAALTKSIANTIEIDAPTLVMEAEGKVYLRIIGKNKQNDSMSVPPRFYINVY